MTTEPITVESLTNPANAYILYDLTSGEMLGGAQATPEDLTRLVFISIGGNVIEFPKADHTYAVLEVTVDGVCESIPDSYAECKTRPEFVNEFIFLTVPPRGAGPAEQGRISYRPEVSVISPEKGTRFSSEGLIRYQATDRNDQGTAEEKTELGIGTAPVSLFYSHLIDSWDFTIIDPSEKTLIAKNLPAAGSYIWKTSGVPEGPHYRIIVDAIDSFGDIGENISEFFSIDRTAPVFVAKMDPPFSKGEDVKISIDSSEDLRDAPTLLVLQKGYTSLPVKMIGGGMHFEGTYQIIRGYDGLAKVFIIGFDSAGNKSETIVSGAAFSVGLNPPPKPHVLYPLDKDILASSSVSIRGTSREDSEVILILNGGKEQKTTPDSHGNFVFNDVELDKDSNKGTNFFSIFARDTSGAVSESETIQAKFNLAPGISIESPIENSLVSGTTTIAVNASDQNNDPLRFTYEVSGDGGENWTLIAETTRSRYVWDTPEVPDGRYIVRVTASDGFVKKEATSAQFTVKNLLPFIRFDGGNRIVTNKKDILLKGSVSAPDKLSIRPNLVSLEYSADRRQWSAVDSIDGAFDSSEERFSVPFSGLKEGTSQIFWRAKDTRGLFGSARSVFIVDVDSPDAPKIISPENSSLITGTRDQDLHTAGTQISVFGTSEPGSIVNILVKDKTFTAKADREGKFLAQGVTLREHGQNILEAFATDIAGNRSDAIKLSLLYNNPPIIKFINPRSGRGLNHDTTVAWDIRDPDGDPISGVLLSYRRGNDSVFTVLSKNPKENSFRWDVSDFTEAGDYELKLEASDGLSKSEEMIPIFIDNTPPAIAVSPLANTALKKSTGLRVTGSASDALSGIEYVEYSIDGDHWFKASITSGFLSKNAVFVIKHPVPLEDGAYSMLVRSVDASGNASPSAKADFFIDTMPPRIGSHALSYGSLILLPDNGVYEVASRSRTKLAVSMEDDTEEASVFLGKNVVALSKNSATGLWEAPMLFSEKGNYELSVSAKDRLGNSAAKKTIATIKVSDRGRISLSGGGETGDAISDANIEVFMFDAERSAFVRWQGENFGEKNPAVSGATGEYEIVLPSGTYQLVIQKSGYRRIKTSTFTLNEPRFILDNFQLERRTGIRGAFEDFLEKIGF